MFSLQGGLLTGGQLVPWSKVLTLGPTSSSLLCFAAVQRLRRKVAPKRVQQL